MSTSIFVRYYDRRKKIYYETNLRPTSLNYQVDMQQFAGSFDMGLEIQTESDLKDVRSQDFAELFFLLPDQTEHQIGVVYFDDNQKVTNAQGMTRNLNGLELLGQLMDNPFAVTKHSKNTTLSSFVLDAITGEYSGAYLKMKGLSPVVGIKNYRGPMRISTDLNQNKGPLLQRYADLAVNLIYQNRLGQVVIYGGTGDGESLGVIEKGVNADSFTVSESYKGVYSEVVTLYASAQASQDKNKVNSPVVKNSDPRVKGILRRPLFKAFTSDQLQYVNETPEERITKIAKSLIRKGNANLSKIQVDVQEPFFIAKDKVIPFEQGQVWTLRSPEPELITKDNLDGAYENDYILSGIHYGQTEKDLSITLLFIEKGYLN